MTTFLIIYSNTDDQRAELSDTQGILPEEGVPEQCQLLHPTNTEEPYRSSVTDIVVWGGQHIRKLRNRRRRRITSITAIEDATESQIQESSDTRSGNRSSQLELVQAVNEPVILECGKCRAPYRKESSLIAHENKCGGAKVKQTIKARACSIAMYMLAASEIGLYTTNQINPALNAVEVCKDVVGYCKREKG